MASWVGFGDELALGPFLRQVTARLDRLSPEVLRSILLAHARGLAATERQQFLLMLSGKGAAADTETEDPADEELVDEIEALRTRLENGEYYDGWGWDDEIGDERAYGDESWALEMDELFDHTGALFLAGHYDLAADAYAALFSVFELNENGNAFSGQHSPKEMLSTNLNEAAARYLRCLYHTSDPADRPQALATASFELEQQLFYLPCSLQTVIDAETEPLDGLEQFLDSWKQVLQASAASTGLHPYSGESVQRRLLREACALSGGVEGLGELAQKDGAHQDSIAQSERTQLLRSTEEIARKSTNAIVSRQYQGAYDRAARLLVAVAEAWCLVGEAVKGTALLVWAREQFPHHSAFKRELTAATAGSQLLRGSGR